jgi:hypothetical protein
MDLFWLWVKEGIWHILDLGAYDHLLYMVVLALPYLVKKFQPLILHITAFTLGHSASLALSSLGVVAISMKYVEYGILLSIILTALSNVLFGENTKTNKFTYLITLAIGCIHGLGFAGFFKSLHSTINQEFVISLLGFNIGVEIAQLMIVLLAFFGVNRLQKVAVVNNKRFVKSISSIILCIAVWLLYKL